MHEGEIKVLNFTSLLREKEQRLHEEIALRVAERSSAEARCSALASHIASSAREHQALTEEMDAYVKKVREQKTDLSDEQFPPVEQDRLFSSVVDALRNALSLPAAVAVPLGEDHPIQATFEPHLTASLRRGQRQNMSSASALSVIEWLLQWTVTYKDSLDEATRLAGSTLTEEEMDLREKQVILEQSARQSHGLSNSVECTRSETVTATWNLGDQRSRHEMVRSQLQREYSDAKATLATHREEGELHLQFLEAQEASLQQELDRLHQDAEHLECSHFQNSLMNPNRSVELLREMCVSENQRNHLLRSQISRLGKNSNSEQTIISPLPQT